MKHPHEDAVLDLARKTLTQEYLKMLAEFIKNKYPESADRLLPELRGIYKSKFKGNR